MTPSLTVPSEPQAVHKCLPGDARSRGSSATPLTIVTVFSPCPSDSRITRVAPSPGATHWKPPCRYIFRAAACSHERSDCRWWRRQRRFLAAFVLFVQHVAVQSRKSIQINGLKNHLLLGSRRHTAACRIRLCAMLPPDFTEMDPTPPFGGTLTDSTGRLDGGSSWKSIFSVLISPNRYSSSTGPIVADEQCTGRRYRVGRCSKQCAHSRPE